MPLPRLPHLPRLALILALICATFLPAAGPAVAEQVVHVDWDGGDDANDGLTQATARRTAPAAKEMRPGMRILFKGGVRYRGRIDIRRDGRPDAPIVLDGNSRGEWGEGRAIIDGSVAVGPWTPAGRTRGGLRIWATDLAPLREADALDDHGFPILFQGEKRGRVASSADGDDNWTPGFERTWFNVARDMATRRSITDPANLRYYSDDWQDAWLDVFHGNNYLEPFKVTGYDSETGTVFHEELDLIRTGDPRYALLNHRDVFDVPGEYLVRPSQNQLLYIAFDDADPNQADVAAMARTLGVYNLKSSHVVIRGFRFTKHRQAGVMMGNMFKPDRHENALIEDNEFLRGGGVILVRSDDSTVRRNRFHEIGWRHPVLLQNVDRGRLENNVFTRVQDGPRLYRTTNSLIKGNVSSQIIGVHGNGLTVYAFSHNNRIIGNHVVSGREGLGLTLRNSTKQLVAFNVISGRRFAVAQWAETEPGDWLDFYNNTLIGNVLIRPASIRRSRFANNYLNSFEMQSGIDSFLLRAFNVYGRLGQGTVERGRLGQGEGFLPPDRALKLTQGAGYLVDARPTPEGWALMRRGGELTIDGIAVNHIGAFRPHGPLDLSRIGLPAHNASVVHR